MGVFFAIVLGMAAVLAAIIGTAWAAMLNDKYTTKVQDTAGWYAVVNAALFLVYLSSLSITIIAAFGSGYLAALNSN